MWRTMNKLHGKIPPANANSNIDADKVNSYFASISNSFNYIEPTHKLSEPQNINYIPSSTVYFILNPKSCPKGTGSDGLPGWFHKLISPAICEPPVDHLQQLHQAGIFSSSVEKYCYSQNEYRSQFVLLSKV